MFLDKKCIMAIILVLRLFGLFKMHLNIMLKVHMDILLYIRINIKQTLFIKKNNAMLLLEVDKTHFSFPV